MEDEIVLTNEQRKQINNLWFIYGNNGKKHTHSDHRFIQCFLEEGKDEREFYSPSVECQEKIDEILNKLDKDKNDY